MLSVIAPTYNECDNVAELIARVLAAFERIAEPAELLVVDDASPDGTAAAVRRCAVEHGAVARVRVIERGGARGLARAVLAGFAQARGDVLVVIDADLSHPPELLPDLLAAVRGGADMALGSRYVRGGGTRGWPASRRWLSRAACLLARGITPVRDATSGYFAVRRSALDDLEVRPRGYKIALELLALLRGRRIVEIPFTFTDRRRGHSKLGGAVMTAYLVQLATLYRQRFPVLLGYLQFGTVGLGGMLVDAIVFVIAFRALAVEGLGVAARGFLAQTASFVVAAGFNFALNAAWTFREQSVGARFHRFLAVSAVGFAVRTAVFETVLSLPVVTLSGGRWPAQEMVALACGIIVASVWNYYGSRRWAFRGAPRAALELPQPVPLRSNAGAMAVLVGVAVLLVFFAARTQLAFDEAYYWQWSRHLAWGYFDHPPMIAYLIAAGTRLMGNNELGVRLVPLLVAVTVPWSTWLLAWRYWQDGVAAAWSLVAMICMPLLAVGMIVATPDSPLLACWAASLLLAIRALERDGTGAWVLAGAAAGLGILSKYPMVLIYPVIFCALLASARGRRALTGPGPWLALAASLVVASPLLAWQYVHAGEGLVFQLQHGLGAAAGAASGAGMPGLAGLWRFLAGQLLVASPILFVITLIALARGAWQMVCADAPSAVRGALSAGELRPFLVFGAAIPLIVFGGASMLARTQPNWLAPAYVTAGALLGGELRRVAWSTARLRLRWASWGGIAVAAAISLYVHVEMIVPLVPYRGGVFTQTWGHRDVAQWVRRVQDEFGGGRGLPILASDYKLASVLAFYLPDHPETCTPNEQASGSAYYAWQPRPRPGSRALIVSNSPAHGLLALFDHVTTLGRHTTLRDGQPVRHTWAYVGTARAGICDQQATRVAASREDGRADP